jgi:arylsulfatase A-like enzyme
MIASVDESVGRVLRVLDELGLAENTLVIFTSDNGGVGGKEREGIRGKDITDNAPLRGGKGMLYEGGVRVPYIFRWPERIQPGSRSELPINSVDLYPTLLEVAGAGRPVGHVLDGNSYLRELRGMVLEAGERPPLFWHFPGYLGSGGNTWRTTPVGSVRLGDWKLMEFFEDGRLELYNLRKDVGEKMNLATEEEHVAADLHRRLKGWRTDVGALMPTPNPNPVPATKKNAAE